MATRPLPETVAAVVRDAPGRVGLAFRRLPEGAVFAQDADAIFTQASAIKIPILWELHLQAEAGQIAPEETLPVEPHNGAGGCGVLQHFAEGASRLTLGDLAVLMIALSDNVATNQLIDRVGAEAVNERLAAFGCVETRLRRKMYDLQARAEGRENTSTPAEALSLMTRLHADAERGDTPARRVLQTLRLQKESPLAAALPAEARLASKPGMLEGLRTEWAVVEAPPVAYAFAMMVDSRGRSGPLDDGEIEPLFTSTLRAVHAAVTAD